MIKVISAKMNVSHVRFWLAASLCLTLSACGGGSSSPQSGGTTASSFKATGVLYCYNCHFDGGVQKFAGRHILSSWLNGAHGNNESLNAAFQQVDLSPDNTGFPDKYFFSTTQETWNSDCTPCHDQRGDGRLLEDFAAETSVTALGRVNRPIIGCESCHGDGANHFGTTGGLPYPRPDFNQCGQCHNKDFDHNEHHPEGDNILENYLASKHAIANAKDHNDHIYVDNSTDVTARCAKCHTDEGARLFKDIAGGHDELEALLPTDPADPNYQAPLSETSPIQCRTCHDPHSPLDLLFADALDATDNVTESGEFRTCTNCHQTEDGYHGENSPHSWSGNAVGVGEFNPERIIYDTHTAAPGDWSGAGGINVVDIAGYTMDKADHRVCRNCHNVHSADVTINRMWAESGHANHAAAAAWAHYNWSGDGSGGSSNRTACQRCHTASGVAAYLTANADNATAYQAPLTYDANWQPEMLLCWGCHADNAGGLRPYAQITADYDDSNGPVVFPDSNQSNICIGCHAGRSGGQKIKDATDLAVNFGSFNSHYRASAGILFRKIGYEFAGLDYANPFGFNHDQAGLADNGTGPCVTCHMDGTPPNHHFSPLVLDDNGTVIDIAASCGDCHNTTDPAGDGYFDLATFEHLQEGFDAAVDALQAVLEGQGIYYIGGAYPYFYNDPAGVSAYTAWSSKDVLGAAFNLNLLARENGAFAHNSTYARRLLYDSIDAVDGGGLDGSVEASLVAGPAYDYLAGTRP